MATVQAVVARGIDELQLTDVELRPVGTADVRVRVAGVGVCHSDLSLLNGTLRTSYPLVLGHEVSGVVVETGEAVSDLQVGDHVVLSWAVPCRTCWWCRHDEPWLCAAVEGVTGVPGGALTDGTPLDVTFGLGGMAEEVVVPSAAAVPVPSEVPLAEAALLGCAVLTGVGGALNAAKVGAGESVLVVGLGGVGLSAVMGARLAGAGQVIACDSSPAKEALAREAGATDFLVAGDDLHRRVRGLTDGRGADRALECVGQATTIRAAWSSVRRGGTCVVVGVGPQDQKVAFSPLELFHFSRTLTSTIYGNTDPARDIPMLLDHMASGDLDVGLLVTDRISLADVPAAFERMRRGEGGRSLVVVEG